MILGSIIVEEAMLWAVITMSFPNTLVRKGVLRYKNHHFLDDNRPQNHMESMSKKLQNFILCCKCIFCCWLARGVHGDVSGVLQTPKTTKICAVFLIIPYNRDLNTNRASPAPRHFAKKCTMFIFRREIDLLKPLLGVTVIPASSVWT